jgi:hypothetical protein
VKFDLKRTEIPDSFVLLILIGGLGVILRRKEDVLPYYIAIASMLFTKKMCFCITLITI